MKTDGVLADSMGSGLVEYCASLDRGWQACLFAAVIVAGTVLVTAL